MAENAASHNPAGETTGPVTGQPPAPATETKIAIVGAAKEDPLGQNAPGKQAEEQAAGGEKKVKTEKELEKERKKAEKLAKFQQKQQAKAAAASTPSAPSKKAEKKKATAEVLPEYKEDTPKGEKKILKSLDNEFLKAYHPRAVESAWYDWWEKEGFFKPEFGSDGNVKPNGYFVIPIPPPNVTGALHCGHAIATALQDLLIRWNRMKGLTALYLPGCDHAGIATQSVVENMLWRRQGLTRHDVGRAKLIETVLDWKTEYHQKINSVLRRLGGSFDWTREAFTMDKNLSAAVTETFVRLHEEGYIYRANRLVNWCTQLNTALSNLEVDNKELTGRTKLSVPGYEKMIEFGVLTHFKYEVEDGSTIEVATTRPETMLGDTGIAVHPNDERYKHLVGKTASHPFIEGRKLLIVADDYVDPEFGTGAVKITPAHDPNDFEIGKRHNLEFITILNDNGTMNKNAGPYEGMKRFDVRYKVVEDLTARGLFVKQEDNPMKVPLCSRSKDVIEPLLKPQWWMRMKELAEPAIKAVEDGSIKIRPGSAHRNYIHWLNNINDWCLSRQLWWGHQIPAYFVKSENNPGSKEDDSLWITGRTEEEALKKAQEKFPNEKFTLERDPDVLDTWFSSGLWPFSTLGWPNDTPDMAKLFPTSLLETGWDILFFWVARMIMLSLKLTGKIPFSEVYCHSLIRDSEGRKMSKSLGNVIDPVDIMDGISLQGLHDKLRVGNLDPKEIKSAEKYQKTAFPQGIPECGADALRFTLIQYTTGGGDIAFDIKVMHAYRRFANKVWQSTKYVLGVLGSDYKPGKKNTLIGGESTGDLWILHRLSASAKAVNEALAAREFSDSTRAVYAFYYDQLCDVFIEYSKAELRDHPERETAIKNALYTALEGGLLMLSPFMPFITEELWQRLPRREGDNTPSICVAEYPEFILAFDNAEAEKTFDLAIKTSYCIKSIMATSSLKNPKLYIKANGGISIEKLDLPDVYKLCQYLKLPQDAIEILGNDQEAPAGCVQSPEEVKDVTVYGKEA